MLEVEQYCERFRGARFGLFLLTYLLRYSQLQLHTPLTTNYQMCCGLRLYLARLIHLSLAFAIDLLFVSCLVILSHVSRVARCNDSVAGLR